MMSAVPAAPGGHPFGHSFGQMDNTFWTDGHPLGHQFGQMDNTFWTAPKAGQPARYLPVLASANITSTDRTTRYMATGNQPPGGKAPAVLRSQFRRET